MESFYTFLSTLSLRRATLGACWVLLTQIFLSTLSLRRATRNGQNINRGHQFLSTLSLRRATVRFRYWVLSDNISIHALLAESDFRPRYYPMGRDISIHALLAESDYTHPIGVFITIIFLSTLSLRRATRVDFLFFVMYHYFYPRSPCGERPIVQEITILTIPISIHALLAESDLHNAPSSYTDPIFLSTLSLRRATFGLCEGVSLLRISIHALLAESDCGCFGKCPCWEYFYPRSPCGERLHSLNLPSRPIDISIHALLAESDVFILTITICTVQFLSTLSLRRATHHQSGYLYQGQQFLSTLSLRRATCNMIVNNLMV